MARRPGRLTEFTDESLALLLGRTSGAGGLAPDPNGVAGKTVLVTGAAGSIGAELCRQIVACKPKGLVMFDANEAALFFLDQELRQSSAAREFGVTLTPLLGSIGDAERLEEVFRRFSVDTVFHTAAYKHVPLLELNFGEAIRNNVLGTDAVLRSCMRHGVSRFVLLSTDKAAAPVSIMGATKRLAELLVGSYATMSPCRMSVVRFGNVFASSGSLVPIILRQLDRGGPVTITDPSATRFFMTKAEAAQLVVAVSGFPTTGGLFMFDMGDPVRIDTLVRRLIEACGFTVKDHANQEGEIEIVYTGLRPGERLEEVAIPASDLLPTAHPKILEVNQGSEATPIPSGELIRVAKRAATEATSSRALGVIQALLPDYGIDHEIGLRRTAEAKQA